MSLVPLVTEFIGKNYREPMAVALYGLALTMCSSAFYVLRAELVRQESLGRESHGAEMWE